MIVLETALPIKFEKSVFESIGIHPKRPHTLKDLELLDQKFEVFENNAELVKKYITDNT
jgi:threonine synthase